MLSIMLSGSIAKQPETRTSKNGNEFATTSVRVQTGEGDMYASVTAFGELAPALARLAKGDPVTVIGTGKVSAYTGKDGEHRAGLSITASRLIALVDHQAPPRPAKTKATGQTQYRPTEEFMSAGPRDFAPAFDDDEKLF